MKNVLTADDLRKLPHPYGLQCPSVSESINAEIAAIKFPDFSEIGNWMSEDYCRGMLDIWLRYATPSHISLSESPLLCLDCVRKWGRILCEECGSVVSSHRMEQRKANYKRLIQSLSWNELERENTNRKLGGAWLRSDWQAALICAEYERRTLLRPAMPTIGRTENLLRAS